MKVKKLLAVLMVVCCLSMNIIMPVSADESTQIMLNGQMCDIPEGYGRVFIQDGRTFVPVRFVTEQLGCAVTYDESDQAMTIYIATNDLSDWYFLQSGSKYLLHQTIGKEATRTEMDVATYYDETECRNYIPVRFLAEAMGYTVDWDEATGIVSLTKAE